VIYGADCGRDFRDTLKRGVCASWEGFGGVVAYRHFKSAAAFHTEKIAAIGGTACSLPI